MMERSLNALRSLDVVFDIKDAIVALGLDRKAAIQQCWRWKKIGLVAAAGKKTGVYYNLFKNPKARTENALLAAAKAIHQPMIVLGSIAINAGGWSTQMGKHLEIAVPAPPNSKPYPQIDGATVVTRPLSWFQIVWQVSGPYEHGVRIAPPEYALVDSIRSRHRYAEGTETVWHPAPDDIAPPGAPEDAIELCLEAARRLKIPLHQVEDFLQRVPDLEDYAPDRSLQP